MQFKDNRVPKALRNGFTVKYALIHALKKLGYNRQQRRSDSGEDVSKFVDFDNLRGLETRISHHAHGDSGELQIHYRQDVEPVLDLANIERNDDLADRQAKTHKWGEEIHLYARIPPVIIMELKNKYGCDIFKRDHLKKAFELINLHYPKFKTTDKTHTLGKDKQVFLS
jgi:hypothetical protein